MASERYIGADHTVYWIERVYNLDTGLAQMPIAGKVDFTQECAFVRLFSPIESLAIVWTAEKEGEPPTLPHPLYLPLHDSNVVFLRQQLAPVAPMLLPSGTGHVHAVSGIYYYGLRKPRAIASDLPTGRMPFDCALPVDHSIPAGYFDLHVLGIKG